MTLALNDQFNLAVNDVPFRGRVTASVVTTAISKFSETPLADPTKQAQRLALANGIIADPTSRTTVFAWIVVTAASLTDKDTITDAQVNTRVSQAFDQAAQQLIPAA